MTDVNITIIGAGVIGLAIAAELSKNHSDVFILEKHTKFGQETSSRNSEVIHSGIYYPANSLKAKLCFEGRFLLYDFCNIHDINYNKCGKLIVATDCNEALKLPAILRQSQANGVNDGCFISQKQINKLEPEVMAVEALFFPSTGIIDSHGLMKQLETLSVVNGTDIAYNNEVSKIERVGENYKIFIKEGDGEYFFTTKYVINAAGLDADIIAGIAGVNNSEYNLHYWKGEYFAIGNGKNRLINHLVYPVPNMNITGLGVHATIDLNGGLKLGPNTVYLPNRNKDYSVDKSHLQDFLKSAGRFLPFLSEDDLHPDQAGIRPKLQKLGDSVRDFIIKEESEKGLPNFINLVGMESPGLTSCLAIAKMVDKMIPF